MFLFTNENMIEYAIQLFKQKFQRTNKYYSIVGIFLKRIYNNIKIDCRVHKSTSRICTLM